MLNYDYFPKIIVFGDVGVGKSTVLQSSTSELFEKDYSMIIGAEFRHKILKIEDLTINLQIWNFTGQERFKHLLPDYIPGAKGAILMYDISNPKSLQNMHDWTQIIRKKAGDIPIIMVGCKADLSRNRKISIETVKQMSKEMGINRYIECSSQTGENVEWIFEALTRLMLHKDGLLNELPEIKD